MNAQQKVSISGKIIDDTTNQAVLYANIFFSELGIGTSSNNAGLFSIRFIPSGTYTVTVSYVGYKEYTGDLILNGDTFLIIKLQKQSLGIQEIRVSAENSTVGTTSSKIKSDAISHVQASSLKEIMQLVPGNLSENPNLADPAKISIREIGTNVNSALGAAVFVDDIPISNDGNMQKSIQGGFASVAGSGVDIRQISVENIESLTVEVGIPSVERGNLTSGAVFIKTKVGASPYNIKLQTDPHTKQAYIGKGYLLQKNLGLVNFDLAYTNSFRNLTKRTDQYKRINATTKYSKTFFRGKSPIHVEVKLDLLSSLDGNKWDPDMLAKEEHFAKDQNIKGKVSALWSVNKAFINSLSFDIGYSKTWQEGFERMLENSSSGPNYFSTALEDGEYQISYGPSSYYSEVIYDGRPFDLFSKLKAQLYKKSDFVINNILIGTEWRTTGNNGEGRIFDPVKPPAGLGTRPRPFSDIPALKQFSIFAEDNMKVKLGTTNLHIQAGVRMDNIQAMGIFKTDGSLSFDPRINIRYELLNAGNNHLFENLAIRMGYGQSTKAPTLTHLYPDKDYNDVESFNYYPELMVTTTKVVHNTKNEKLRPSASEKFELGIDFHLGRTKTRLTGFYEKHKGGFILDQTYFPMLYRDYDVLQPHMQPYYIQGEGIYYDNTSGSKNALGYEYDEKFVSYSQYRNAGSQIKRGIEYTIDIGKIQVLKTALNINGAWFQTESFSSDVPYWKETFPVFESGSNREETFIVKFPNQNAYGVVSERLNTNLNFVTHIPEIKILLIFTTQAIWYEKNVRKIYDEFKLYSLSELRDYLKQPAIFSSDSEDNFYYYLPLSYKYYDNIEHQYQISDFENLSAQGAIQKEQKYRFNQRVLPALYLCNIKISKEMGQHFKLSFYANNFLNIRPWVLDERSGKYLRRNQQPYFGGEIKMQF